MKTVISIILSATFFTAQAQFHSDSVKPMITKTLGASFQKFDGLNSRVAGSPQFKQLPDYAATIGLGWLKEKKRVISSGGVTLGSSMSGDKDEKSSTIRFIGVNADLGYDLISSERVMLYPLVGLGFQHYQAIFYKDNSNVPFDDVLNSASVKNDIQSVRFNNSFFVYRAGLGFNLKSPKNPANTIGLQAGYTGSFNDNSWRSNENQALANSPTDKVGQFFVSLVLTSAPCMFK